MSTTTSKSPRKTRAELEQRVQDLEAQLPSALHVMDNSLRHASKDRLMASAVVLELRHLGGKQIGVPVAIRDGLSDSTIAAIRQDLADSYALAVEFKPSKVPGE